MVLCVKVPSRSLRFDRSTFTVTGIYSLPADQSSLVTEVAVINWHTVQDSPGAEIKPYREMVKGKEHCKMETLTHTDRRYSTITGVIIVISSKYDLANITNHSLHLLLCYMEADC